MRGPVGVVLALMLAALPVASAALDEGPDGPAPTQSRQRLAPCLACHGEKGQSEQPEVPSLGAQPAFYVMVQLYMFRERLRTVEVMNAMTQGLTDDDLRSMADIIAQLPPPRPVEAPGDPVSGSNGRVRSFSSTGVISAITRIFPVPSRCRGWLASVRTTS